MYMTAPQPLVYDYEIEYAGIADHLRGCEKFESVANALPQYD